MKQISPERLLLYAGVAVLAVLFVWFQLDLLLLTFAGVLVAVILRTITGWIDRHTRLSGMLAYLATLLLLGAALAGAALFLAPRVTVQLSELVRSLPYSMARLEAPLGRSHLGRELLGDAHQMMRSGDSGAHIQQIAGIISGAVTDLIIVLVIGFFAALNPRGYAEGLLALVPSSARQRTRQIAEKIQHQLRWWMLGQMLPMAVLGVASAVGLMILHVHLPWTLGLLTGLAVFLPFAGTLLAGVPSVLMGLQRSPHTALWVLLLYLLLHLAEGYILTPLVQRKAVRLPPVLTILAQYFLWSVAGILGLALAAPLAGAGIVLVKELYLHVPAEQTVVPELTESRKSA